MSQRIDKEMYSRGLVKTRSQARMLIVQGDVYLNGQLVRKAGQLVTSEDQIEIKAQSLFVSRGAYKLKKALDEFQIETKGKVAADVGASTGGFTQLLLQKGVKKVYAIDVGHDQIAQELIEDSRVVNLEGVNIKFVQELEEKVDIAVVDLSFISIKLVIENILNLIKESGEAVVLIKPQFEAGKSRLGKKGIVSEQMRTVILEEMKSFLKALQSCQVLNIIESPIQGKDGNVEYLAHMKKL